MTKSDLRRFVFWGGLASFVILSIFLREIEFNALEFVLVGVGIYVAISLTLQSSKIRLVNKQLFILTIILCGIFLAYIATGAFHAYIVPSIFKVIFKWAEIFILAIFVFLYIDKPRRFNNIYWFLFFINLALVVQALIKAPFSEGIFPPPRIRVGPPTVFSIALLLPFATKRNLRILLYFLFIVLIFSQFRVSWIGFGVVLFLFLFLIKNNFKLKKKIIIPILLVIVAILIIPSSRNIVINRIQKIGILGEQLSPSVTDRIYRLQASFRAFLDYPIFGVGAGNILPYIKQISWGEKLTYLKARLRSPEEIFLTPHNVFVEYLAQFGLIGFTIFVLMLGLFYKIISSIRQYNHNYLKYKPELIGIYLYFFAFLVYLTLGYIAGTDRVMIGVYFGLILGLFRLPTFYFGFNKKPRL